jgi:hypothetical protein
MALTHISMDFIERLPKSQRQTGDNGSGGQIHVMCYLIPLSHPYTVLAIAQVFMHDIVKLYEVPLVIICDKDIFFKQNFGKDYPSH